MAVRVSPADGVARWVQNLSASGPRITTGVNAVSVSPGQRAAAQKAKWIASLSDPQVQNKWASRVGAVSLEEWRDLMVNVGIPRIASGAQAKQGKYLAFAEKFYPFLSRVVGQIDALDSSSFQARVQRAVQFMTLVHNYNASTGA